MGKSRKATASQLTTCVSLLRRGLEGIEAKMMALFGCSTIEIFENDPGSEIVFIGAPKYYWGKPDDQQRRLQMELKKRYGDWFEQLQLLLADATEDLSRDIEETDSFVQRCIEKNAALADLSLSMDENKARFRKEIGVFYGALATLDDPARSRVVLVPDTNSLIRCPEPREYAGIADNATFDIVLLPTVLGELDDLKIKHRDEAFREKVDAVIRRIKGWRKQGDLREGVTVDKTVTVRTVAREPNFQRTLHWLDRTNRDDRVIASVLELQRALPSAAIVLVTDDINLQNKAQAASLPYAEGPTSKPAPPKPWEGVLLEGADAPRYFDWGRRMLAVESEDASFRMTPEFQHKVCELLWQRDDVSPQFRVSSNEPRRWVYETDRGRTWKRKLRAHFDEQYLVATERREPPPPKCPSCGKRGSLGTINCPDCAVPLKP